MLEHDQAREILGSGWIYWVIQSDSVGNLGVLAFNSEDYQMIVAGWILVESYEQFWAQLRFLLWRWRCVMPLGSNGGKIVVFFVLENGTWYHQEQQHVDFFLKVDRYGGSQDLRPGELNEFPSDSRPVE